MPLRLWSAAALGGWPITIRTPEMSSVRNFFPKIVKVLDILLLAASPQTLQGWWYVKGSGQAYVKSRKMRSYRASLSRSVRNLRGFSVSFCLMLQKTYFRGVNHKLKKVDGWWVMMMRMGGGAKHHEDALSFSLWESFSRFVSCHSNTKIIKWDKVTYKFASCIIQTRYSERIFYSVKFPNLVLSLVLVRGAKRATLHQHGQSCHQKGEGQNLEKRKKQGDVSFGTFGGSLSNKLWVRNRPIFAKFLQQYNVM